MAISFSFFDLTNQTDEKASNNFLCLVLFSCTEDEQQPLKISSIVESELQTMHLSKENPFSYYMYRQDGEELSVAYRE